MKMNMQQLYIKIDNHKRYKFSSTFKKELFIILYNFM